jgi:hypothetical protein
MKKCIMLIIALIYSFFGANTLFAAANTWTQKADLGGTARYLAVGFSIGNKGYTGMGQGYSSSDRPLKDFWEFDPVLNTWTQKADFGGTARTSAVGFSIGSKGYIGMGNNSSKDFWEFDPVLNTWTQKADFGGEALGGAVGFSIGSRGYIGTGTGYYGHAKKDFWEYNPAANTWTQKAYFGGTARTSAVGFSIGSKGYIGTGIEDTEFKNDFWEYNPAANTWTQKADFGGNPGHGAVGRYGAVGFSIFSKGYIGTGYNGFYLNDFFEFDPVLNTWTQKADFEGGRLSYSVGFSIGSKGYIRTGIPEFWEYDPSTSSACTYTLSSYADEFAATSTLGFVTVTPSSSSCSWTAVSNILWITITAGSAGTGNGTVSYSVSTNTTGSNRTGTMTIGEQTFTVTQDSAYIPPSTNMPLYFPHVDTSLPWQTEIAIINTSDQTVTGTLRGLSNDGQLIETKAVTLSARGRTQIIVANEFTNHINIGYIIFDTSAATVQGYAKLYQAGIYRAATPAVKVVNTGDIYVSHIDSSAQWWTGVTLVNTTSTTKNLTITFDNGVSVPYTLNPNQRRVFTIGSLLNQPLQPDIRSAVITNASGVIGLELFGSNAGMGGNQMEGILLTDKTASTIYYPHIDSNGWWTGIVAYNPSETACTITITPYSAQGTVLATSTIPIAGKGKYVGVVSQLGLPAQTAWFRIDATSPITGFELFGTASGNQLAAYSESGGTGSKSGVFPKIEKNGGWTGIAFVNTEENAASVTLTAYNDSGAVVATQVLNVGGHAKVVNFAETIFMQNISGATYIAYTSDRNVVGFQLNGSSDGMMLDALPGLPGNYGGISPQCHNIAGNWHFTSSGTVTCSIGGETTTEHISGQGTVSINQNGCNVNWLVPGTTYSRSGTVSGNSIQVSGIFMDLHSIGASATQNTISASGTISEDTKTIILNGIGIASGYYEGTPFSCSGTDTSTFTRTSLSSVSSIMYHQELKKKQPVIFLNHDLRILTVLPIGD